MVVTNSIFTKEAIELAKVNNVELGRRRKIERVAITKSQRKLGLTMSEEEFKEVETGNGKAANLAATTNERLKKTVLELRGLGEKINTLNTNLVKFSGSSDKYSKRLVLLTWGLVVFASGSRCNDCNADYRTEGIGGFAE